MPQAVAAVLALVVALGPAAPPPPPQFTESLGGNGAVPKELTALDKQMISAGQFKPADYEKISGNFKPGQTNALE